ncbi:unnamed protein product [Haemonchus placei]|uniref:AMP-binding domain-containing protein n=1 Tax=Haemonchus placei TaxID=6290 RepID=A0A0N4WQ03_HAEPC|nr:unnamed protein product [Haemonchus placei]
MIRKSRFSGFAKGDVALFVMDNSPAFAVSHLGVLKCGGTITSASPSSSRGKRLKHYEKLRNLNKILCFQLLWSTKYAIPKRASFLQTKPFYLVSSDLAVLPYTDVMKEVPMGMILTHQNVSTAVDIYQAYMERMAKKVLKYPDCSQESLLLCSSFASMYGLLCLNIALIMGFTSVILKKFEPLLVFNSVRSYRVRLWNILKTQQKYQQSKCIWKGKNKFVTDVLSVCPSTGELKGLEEKGEVCLRGPTVMRGYMNDNAQLNEDGWYQTGNERYSSIHNMAGRLHANIFLFVTLKTVRENLQMFRTIRLCRQVSLAELEDVLLSHPSISDAAVISILDEGATQKMKAFVVQCDEKLTAEDVLGFVDGESENNCFILYILLIFQQIAQIPMRIRSMAESFGFLFSRSAFSFCPQSSLESRSPFRFPAPSQ